MVKELGEAMAAQIAAVQAVHAEHAGSQGFRRLHSRRELPEPLLGRSFTATGLQPVHGVGFGDLNRALTRPLESGIVGGARFRAVRASALFHLLPT